MSTSVVNVLLAVLKFPAAIAAFIVYAKTILTAMTGNANFTGSVSKLTKLATDVKTLDDAQTGIGLTPPTHSGAQRDAALRDVKAGLRSLRLDVQDAADKDPVNAQTI